MIVKLLLLAVGLAAVNSNAVVSRQGNLNSYYLYTLSNREVGIPISVADFEVTGGAVPIPELQLGVQTIFIVHGHGGDHLTDIILNIKNAYMLRNVEINVIVVDWSAYTKQTYSNAVAAVPSVGHALGEFINFLVNEDRITLDLLHIVGFNLGAHVAGFAGRNVEGNVPRITGLDPSGSQWGSNTQRLSSGDATYVEVFHTDGGGLGSSNGIGTAIGDIDFFVNGGKNQPGCLTHACSHDRACDLFAATLVRETSLLGNLCATNLQLNLNTCRGWTVPLGGIELSKLGSRGIYRVNTGRTFPF